MYNFLFTSGGSNTATAENTNTNTGRRIQKQEGLVVLDFPYSIFSNMKNIGSWELNPGQDSFEDFWERFSIYKRVG